MRHASKIADRRSGYASKTFLDRSSQEICFMALRNLNRNVMDLVTSVTAIYKIDAREIQVHLTTTSSSYPYW